MSLRRPGELPRPSAARLLARAAVWALAVGILVAGVACDVVRRRHGPAAFGRRLRALFERVGYTAVKLGQQLSVRSDVLPEAVCRELAGLVDSVRPIPSDLVPRLVEAELGRPLAEVFPRFEPVPLGSASVACVYAAELADGSPVAVKLRRPGVVERFAADVAAFELFLALAELLTIFRDGTFTHLRHDVRTMLGEETSFKLEARFQRLFRREVRQAGLPWIDAPEVIGALSTDALLVTRFVEGVPMPRVLAAHEAGRLAELGVDPARVAARLVRFSLWARFEADFFHADPHPGNLFVLPDDRLVIVDFGGCGVTSARTRRNHAQIMRQTLRGDRSIVARMAISDLSPVPRFDTHAFLEDTEDAFGAMMLAMHDPNAHWTERIVVSVWLRLLEVTHRYQIRVNLDTVRSMRAFLLYDSLVGRLDPSQGFGPFRRYLREALRRRAERYRRGRTPTADAADVLRAARATLETLRPVVETVQVTWQRVARARVVALRGGARAVQVAALALAVGGASRLAGVDPAPWLAPLALGGIGLVIARATQDGLHALGQLRTSGGTA